jgi:hypothetical protein
MSHFEFDYILNLYVLFMCFMRYRNWIVCTIRNAARTFFSDENFEENFGIPLAPQVHTLQYRDHSGYRSFWLIRNNSFVAKIWCGHWSNFCWLGQSYFSVTLSCKVPYFHSNFRVVMPQTAGCGLCFPAISVSGTVTCIQALWYAVWCMGGWLVLAWAYELSYLSYNEFS